MSSAFERALARTLDFEGGHVHHPKDRGGPTNRGVTQRAYDNWRVTTGQPKRSVDLITWDELSAIYLDNYWKPTGCPELPEPLAMAVFDMAVNSGPWNAKVTLQDALNVAQDGVVGPMTLLAAKSTPDSVLRFLKKRGAFIQEIVAHDPSQAVFLEGWINRLLEQAWELR